MEFINVGNNTDKRQPYSDAVKINDRVYCSGVLPLDLKTGSLVEESFEARVHQCMDNLSFVLLKAGTSIKNIFSVKVYIRNLKDIDIVNKVFSEYFKGGNFPARTCIEVKGLNYDCDIEIDCIAHDSKDEAEFVLPEEKSAVTQVIRIGDHLYCSGVTSNYGSFFKSKVVGCLDCQTAILENVGFSIQDVYLTRVYLKNIKEKQFIREAFLEYFPEVPVGVMTEVPGSKQDVEILIESEAYAGGINYLKDNKYLQLTEPFAPGVKVGDYIYCSAVRPIDPGTGQIIQESFEARARQCMNNLEKILISGGATLNNVFETRVYLKNMGDISKLNKVFREYFRENQYPIRSTIEVSGFYDNFEGREELQADIGIQCSAFIGE